MQLALYDFTIYYRKGTLNPVDSLLRRPDYTKVVRPPNDNSTVTKLMPTLSNKLTTVSSGACEQSGVEGSDSSATRLIQVLSLQVVTRLAARRALSPKGPESLFSFQNEGLLDPSDDDDTRSDASTDPE